MSVKDLPVVNCILGIDLGSRRTGFAVLELKEPGKLIHKGRIVVEDPDYIERWRKTIVQLDKLMTEFIMGRPVAVAVEQPNSGRNMQSTRELTGAFGALMYWLYENGMGGCSFDVNTSHAKKVFCSKGGGGKQQTIDRANSLYGLSLKYHSNPEKTEDDIADAIQVAFTLRQELIESDDWFKKASQSA